MANLAEQASLAARIKEAPQRTALETALSEAESGYRASVQAGRTTGALDTAAVNQAIPQVQGIYNRATTSAGAQSAELAKVLEGLGPRASTYAASRANEATAGKEKLGREEARALTDLQQQKTAAAEQPGFARTLASQQLNSTLAKIFGQQQSLAGTEGADAQDELNKLTDEAKKNALTERGQNFTHADSEASRAQKAQEHKEDLAAKNAGDLPGGVKPLTGKEQDEGASQIATIKNFAQHSLQAGRNREQVQKELEKGGPSISGKLPNGTSFSHAGRKAYESGPLLEAALDEAQYGYVTHQTAQALHTEGYTLKALGLTGPPAHPLKHAADGVAGALGQFFKFGG